MRHRGVTMIAVNDDDDDPPPPPPHDDDDDDDDDSNFVIAGGWVDAYPPSVPCAIDRVTAAPGVASIVILLLLTAVI